MNQIIFQREVFIDAPLTHVWQLIATERGLQQWWGNTIALEAKEGGRCEEWRMERDRLSHWQGVITDYAPLSHLTMTLRAQDDDQAEPRLATIHIALETRGVQTRVHVTHRAFAYNSALATDDPRTPLPQPTTRSVPLAQLDQPAPGSIPMPSVAAQSSGRIAPSHLLVSQRENDALTAIWQARLTSLASATNAK